MLWNGHGSVSRAAHLISEIADLVYDHLKRVSPRDNSHSNCWPGRKGGIILIKHSVLSGEPWLGAMAKKLISLADEDGLLGLFRVSCGVDGWAREENKQSTLGEGG